MSDTLQRMQHGVSRGAKIRIAVAWAACLVVTIMLFVIDFGFNQLEQITTKLSTIEFLLWFLRFASPTIAASLATKIILDWSD